MADKYLGEKLQKLRKGKGLTQQEAADILGLKNKTTLASWEYGKSEPDIATFLKLGDIYGKDSFEEEFFPWVNDEGFSVTLAERKQIKKYRFLDPHGKRAVDMTLEHEYERCKDQTAQKTSPLEDLTIHKKLAAMEGGGETTKVDKAAMERRSRLIRAESILDEILENTDKTE